jgi:hypothetical protein
VFLGWAILINRQGKWLWWKWGFETADTPIGTTWVDSGATWGTDWLSLMGLAASSPFVRVGDIPW